MAQQTAREKKVYNNIVGELYKAGLTVPKYAKLVGVCKSTMYRRLEHYKAMNVGELEKLCRTINISISELLK